MDKKDRKKNRRRRRKREQQRVIKWLKGLSTKKKILLGVGVALIIIFLAAVVFVASKFSKMQENDVKEEEIYINELPEEVGVGYTNIALFGVDSRNGINEKGTRTDCIIIASLNNETKEIKLVSVYRDTLLDITNGSIQKCNAAYAYGTEQQAISMLNMNLDLNITDYVTVDWSAVIDTVDLLGGLEIDVKQEEIAGINEHMISTAEATGNKMTPVTKAGLQTLNGVQATTYCRIRSTAGSDFARTERQRYVIEKMFEKALKSDLKTINNIIDEIFPKIKTSLTLTEILNYAKSFTKYTFGETTGFPIEKTTGTIPGKGSSVIPVTLTKNVTLLHEFLFGTEDYSPSSKVASISSEIQSIVGSRKADTNSSGGTTTTTPSDTTTTEPNATTPSDTTTTEPVTPSTGTVTPDTGNEDGSEDESGEGGDTTTAPGGDTATTPDGDTTTTPGGDTTTTPGGDTTTTPGGDTNTTPSGDN